MITTSVAAAALAVTFVSYLAITTYISWQRLSRFPGPFFSSISYLPMLLNRLFGRSYREHAVALSDKYGSLVRIGPNDLFTSSPELIRKMSSVRSTFVRSSWYKATRLDPYHDMMGSVLDKSTHQSLRAKVAEGYMGKDCPTLETDIDSQIASLIALLRRSYLSTRSMTIPVDFGQIADYYAHDARSDISFGKPLGCLQKNADVHGIIATVKVALEVIQVFTDIPPLHRIFLSSLTLKLLGPKPTDNWGVGKLMGLARELVAERFETDTKYIKKDLLGSFLRRGLDRRSAESEVMFPIIAGADTAATAIKNTVLRVVATPTVYARLMTEIDAAAAEGKISTPVTHAEALELPYLQAVILEGLRVYPPFAGLIMKQAGPNGEMFDGHFIPAGTRVGHNTWAVSHDKSIFGNDANDFRPERWLEADPKRRVVMQKQADLVFGSGRWGCPGKAVALIELNKILVELFRTFEFATISTVELTEHKRCLKPQEMPIRVMERVTFKSSTTAYDVHDTMKV